MEEEAEKSHIEKELVILNERLMRNNGKEIVSN